MKYSWSKKSVADTSQKKSLWILLKNNKDLRDSEVHSIWLSKPEIFFEIDKVSIIAQSIAFQLISGMSKNRAATQAKNIAYCELPPVK